MFFAIFVVSVVSFVVFFAPEFIRGILEVSTWIRPSLIAWVILGLVLSQTALIYRFSVNNKKKKLKRLLERVITIENLVFGFMFLFSVAHPFLVTARDWVITTMEEYKMYFCIAYIISGSFLLFSMVYFTVLKIRAIIKEQKKVELRTNESENMIRRRDMDIDLYVPLANKKTS